jgi:hypothetical protein
VENVAEMKAAGMAWLALNVGDGHDWLSWETVRRNARAADVETFPWKRCRTLGECRELLELGSSYAAKAILNIEDEFKDVCAPAKVAELVFEYSIHDAAFDVGISTVGWLYNDCTFLPLSNLPVLLQVFAADNKWAPAELQKRQAECVTHARDKGFTYVGVTYQTYAGAKPEWYAFAGGATRSWFTADDIGGGRWGAWK